MTTVATADFWSGFDWAGMAQKVGVAVLILVVAWVLAKIVKTLFAKLVGKIGFLQREDADGKTLGESLGQIASLLVWLFALVAVLQVFSLERALAPIQSLLDGVMAYLPNLIGAVFLFIVGSMIAKILRQLVETGLRTVNFDKWLNRGGADAVTGGSVNLSKTIATIVYALVMIVVAIAALQVLGISAIADPAQQMLEMIFNAIPAIIAAALILGIGYAIARFAGGLLEDILKSFGTDRALGELEIFPEGKSASAGLAKVAQVAIMVFFAIMAARMLGFPEITRILNEVLALGGKVLFGAVVIAAGFIVAKLVARLAGEGTGATIVRWAIIVLFVAMGLEYMGIADSIIQLAFGAVVIGGAIAAALAFGLGGRDAAGRALNRLEQSRATDSSSTSSTKPASTE